MSSKDVDVAERHITETDDRTSIVHQLSHFVTAVAELRKPLSCNRTELGRLSFQPGIDGGVPFDGSFESKYFVHEDALHNGTRLQTFPL
jgi:hypothetical protein